MKEQRYFYTPSPSDGILPPEEAAHAIRVLRLKEGDEINLVDGCGTFHIAEITATTKRDCHYQIIQSLPQPPAWKGRLELAMAPTKHADRTEWLAEKATEIGIDCLTFLDTRFAERHTVNTQRIQKIMISAMKQSHKSRLPVIRPTISFADFINSHHEGQRFICHCYDTHLPRLDSLIKPGDALVMIGPEGDFSLDEVQAAEAAGFKSVSLGRSRLRTETAALVAVHLMQLASELPI